MLVNKLGRADFIPEAKSLVCASCETSRPTDDYAGGSKHAPSLSKPGIPNLSLTMYPFSISTDNHVLPKFLMTKYFIIEIFSNKHNDFFK